jgi:hypothetical protein
MRRRIAQLEGAAAWPAVAVHSLHRAAPSGVLAARPPTLRLLHFASAFSRWLRAMS